MKCLYSLLLILGLSFTQWVTAAAPVFTSPASASSSIPLVGQSIVFTAAASDPQGLPIVYSYDYGDGEVDLLGTHTYTVAGTYTVTITASNCDEIATTTLPVVVKGFANLWVKKQSIKLGTPGKGSWNAAFIYNADRTAAGIFNSAEDTFATSLGNLAKVQVNPAQFAGKAPKFKFKSAKGIKPALSVVLNESTQTIAVSGKSETFSSAIPNVLSTVMQLGSSFFAVDTDLDLKGKFAANAGYRSAAFVVAKGTLKVKAAGKDAAKFSLLLGDPAFQFPGLSGAATVRFRISNSAGTVVLDKDFSSIATFSNGKLKTSKDISLPAGKFSYDSAKGKMSAAISKATLAGILSAPEEHVGVDVIIGDQTYSTRVTLFAPKAGAYSTKMGKGQILVPGTSGQQIPSLPTVLATNPLNDAMNVALNQKISAVFSEPMDAATITTESFMVMQGATMIAGTITVTGKTATFTPTLALPANSMFMASLSTAVKDAAGNAQARPYLWCFHTGATVDIIAPTVISTQPANNATNVASNQTINATFSEAMAEATLTTTNFTVAAPNGISIEGSVTFDALSNIASFTPASVLSDNTTYTATLSTAVQDLAGNGLAANFVWSFTTGTQLAQGGIFLGSAGNFGILAGSTVTSTGFTVINGDLGVSPGTAVEGFPPGIVNGSVHAGNETAAQAKDALLAAYNDGASRLNPAVLPGNLGGLTFTPGLYKNESSTGITGTGPLGILTLDAQGDPNAVFIFQMASTLTTDPSTQVVLAGGAKAANIYWQVGSSATLGTTSTFKGNILADQSITLNTGATLDGRALTRIGAVTLDASTVTKPAP